MIARDGTYIVTGATGGIGSAIVRMLAERGVCRIVLACRNVEKARKLMSEVSDLYPETDFAVEHLDLCSFASVRDFVARMSSDYGGIAALVNNAGAMPVARSGLTADGYDRATQVNFLATALLTCLITPLVTHGGHIVFTTSVTRCIVGLKEDWEARAERCNNRFVTYGRSKLMLTHFALDMSRRLKDNGLHVNCSDPGVVDSDMVVMGNRFIDGMSRRFFRPYISTPEQGAEPVIHALESGMTGQIFTRRHVRPIPASYGCDARHHLVMDAVDCLL